MSRIHDALRRGRASANSPAPPRSAHADAVLAALGYRSGKAGAGRSLILTLAVIAIAIATGWALWPVVSRTEDRGASRDKTGASSGPVRSQAPAPPTLPAVSIPAQGRAVTSPALAVKANAAVVGAPQVPRPTAPVVSHASAPRAPLGAAPASSKPPAPIAPPTSRIAARDPPSAPSRDDFQLALYYQRAGDFEQALLHYREALQRDEMNVEAHNNLGSLYLGRNLLDEAAREFQRVLAIDPGYAPAHINLSAALYRLGRFDAAAAQAREALRIDPRNGDAFVNLALAQKATGQHGDSQGSLRRALELNSRHAIAHYNLARQYEESGETVRALEHYGQFLQYAGPEQEFHAVDVRARVRTLQARAIR